MRTNTCARAKTRNAVLTFRFHREEAEQLRDLARRSGSEPTQVGARFVVEGLRRAHFTGIDFRDTPVGRQAYLAGTRLAVWMVVAIIRSYGNHLPAAAKHLRKPTLLLEAALNYARAYPEEIEAAIRRNESVSAEELRRLLPGMRTIQVK
jgi:uncharacterized protein (DUF433 family)